MGASYLRLYESGELERRISTLEGIVGSCTLCPRTCKINRLEGERGICRTGALPRIASYHSHHGEERPISGRRGSGTIFFSGCNLACVFCQNSDISQLDMGREVEFAQLSQIMVELQRDGCHNINFVTPTHVVYAILRALPSAIESGLSIPLVYNSGGYDSTSVLKVTEGVFDIYMPDFKYGSNAAAARFSGIADYVEVANSAIREMHRQVGDLEIDKHGIAIRGLIVRHLYLPDDAAASRSVIDAIAEISNRTYLNIMDQYRPMYRAANHPELRRRPAIEEFRSIVRYARERGLTRIYRD